MTYTHQKNRSRSNLFYPPVKLPSKAVSGRVGFCAFYKHLSDLESFKISKSPRQSTRHSHKPLGAGEWGGISCEHPEDCGRVDPEQSLRVIKRELLCFDNTGIAEAGGVGEKEEKNIKEKTQTDQKFARQAS